MACGFSDGTALLLQGELSRSPLQPQPAPLLIQPGEDNPSAVTALHFSKGQDGSSSAQVVAAVLPVAFVLGVPSQSVRRGFVDASRGFLSDAAHP